MTTAPQGDGEPCDQPGVICTVAGTGQSLFDGDGRPALRTSFNTPLDVAFDADGQPLILDWNSFRVRRINDDTSVHTIMGFDFEDFPRNGALAVETPLHHASDIETDSAGRLYVAGNHAACVFRIDLDDRVDVLAGTLEAGNDGDGGLATAAKVEGPFGILPMDDGSFYLADIEAHVVRFVDSDGMISTIAGNGERGYEGDGGPGVQAKLSSPTRLARDRQGNLYFCDTDNHAIRRVDGHGMITTFAGTGVEGFSGDGGFAAAAQFSTPYGLCFAPNGDLYVADTGNHVIRRIDSAGIVTSVVGTGAAGFTGDEGPAGQAQLNGPSGVIFDDNGSMWIADSLNNRVRRVAEFLCFIEACAGSP